MTHDASGSFAVEASGSLFNAYTALAKSYDEMFDASRRLRPHWARIVAALDDLGQQELARRWEQARRMIHENGVTYNVYGDPRGWTGPGSLTPFP